jgi:capsular polysaccharide biosynthesis protein
VGDRAIPQLKDGRFVLEEMGTESMLKRRVSETYHSFSRREKIRQIFSRKNTDFGNYDYNSIINMVPRHGASHNNYINYGHWIAEDLPRLRGLKHYCENTERRPDILIKSDPPSWMIKTLQLLGFSPSNWTEWDRNGASVLRLIVPKHSYVHTTGAEFQPSDRAWVSNQMKSYADISPEADSPKRIFISRQGQGRRKIINYDEVMASLSEFSFESIRPENFSIEKQIRMFDQAEIIVGPSGSGLVNVIFTDDSSLLEIKPHGTKITVWNILATESGLQYDYIRGKQDASNNKKGRNSDIRVNVEDLNNVVSELLNQS